MDTAGDPEADHWPERPLLEEEEEPRPSTSSLTPLRASSTSSLNRQARVVNASRMRTNLIGRVWRGLQSSRAVVTFYVASFVLQASVCATMLLVERNNECDTPLHLYLTITLVRLCLSTPLYIYQKLYARPQDPDILEVSPAERLLSVIDFFNVIWFVAGNWWYFTSETCQATSPLVYYTSLAFIMLGYMVLLTPLLLCIGMICCFPCLLIALRYIDTEPAQGTPPTLIKAIPTETYDVEGQIAKEDAVCAICLGEYENGEQLKRLPCQHHFHSKCIDDWLPLSRNCPLCMQKVDRSLDEETTAEDV